ncbi:serine/threonine-protein kinase [Hyalangium versicolor]|uniref:serine/threonine-protein kinase n=1 Tax=Hyalangium versicolor TaxID=2861190 RepID=UPI001CCC400F|nr:serine/threonine-protein kinase [Hyalangium versicolor]
MVGRRGLGVYGAVYCAVKLGQEQAGLVAVKLAVHEGDLRFQREVELLSRARHPSIPRLLDHGEWRSPAGRVYPYIVMEWVEGQTLYEWSAEHNPSTRQVVRVLAQVARALEATHAAGGVHRDVKGDNVRVREGDGKAFLLDFGAGRHMGASQLTWDTLPPGTPSYRSPEAWRSILDSGQLANGHYTARSTDDLFALGVMAYRLVTEEYPPSLEPRDDDEGRWYVPVFSPRPPRERNARVDSRLSAIILRMLSENPEARGSARELAEALEQLAEQAGPEGEEPLFEWETREASERSTEDAFEEAPLGYPRRRRVVEVVREAEQRDARARAAATRFETEKQSRQHSVTPLLWVGLVGLLMLMLVITAQRKAPRELRYVPSEASVEASDGGAADAGTAGVGETALTSVVAIIQPIPSGGGIRLEIPPQPLPGQRIAPCGRGEREIQGGCWVKLDAQAPECGDYAYVWKGGCYIPTSAPQRPSTSDER